MKKLLIGFVAVFLSACGQNAAPEEPVASVEETPAEIAAEIIRETEGEAFEVAPSMDYFLIAEESEFFWRGEKVGGGHEGIVLIQEGLLTKENGTLTGNFIIDMNNIIVTDIEGDGAEKLAEKLKNDDYFAASSHPTATFVITKSEALNENKYAVTGDLTIKGLTHPIEFEVEFAKLENRLLALADFTIDRTLWNVGGAGLLKNDIIVKLTLSFIDSESLDNGNFAPIDYEE